MPPADDPYVVLHIPPTASARDIETAYWIRARELKAARADNPDVDLELERLNRAYHRLASGAPHLSAPSVAGRRVRLWLRRLLMVAVATGMVAAAAVTALAFRSEIEDLSEESREQVEEFADDAQRWLGPPEKTPVPEVRAFLVDRTGGVGAYIRQAPSYGATGIVAHSDGTQLTAVGEEAVAEGETWLRVRDAQGREGWISSRWLSPAGDPATQ